MISDSSRIVGIIVTHGRLADAFVKTVEGILGKTDDLFSLSADELRDSVVVSRIREIIAGTGVEKVVLFVDYSGGSCYSNCARATQGCDDVRVVSGVNLPVLLDFMTKRKIMGFDEMVDHLIKRGRDSIDYTCF